MAQAVAEGTAREMVAVTMAAAVAAAVAEAAETMATVEISAVRVEAVAAAMVEPEVMKMVDAPARRSVLSVERTAWGLSAEAIRVAQLAEP